jgi:hypothetical protein
LGTIFRQPYSVSVFVGDCSCLCVCSHQTGCIGMSWSMSPFLVPGDVLVHDPASGTRGCPGPCPRLWYQRMSWFLSPSLVTGDLWGGARPISVHLLLFPISGTRGCPLPHLWYQGMSKPSLWYQGMPWSLSPSLVPVDVLVPVPISGTRGSPGPCPRLW